MSSIRPQATLCLDNQNDLDTGGVVGDEICDLSAGNDATWPGLPAGCADAGYSAITSDIGAGTFSYTATCVTGACEMTCAETGCTPIGC